MPARPVYFPPLDWHNTPANHRGVPKYYYAIICDGVILDTALTKPAAKRRMIKLAAEKGI